MSRSCQGGLTVGTRFQDSYPFATSASASRAALIVSSTTFSVCKTELNAA